MKILFVPDAAPGLPLDKGKHWNEALSARGLSWLSVLVRPESLTSLRINGGAFELESSDDGKTFRISASGRANIRIQNPIRGFFEPNGEMSVECGLVTAPQGQLIKGIKPGPGNMLDFLVERDSKDSDPTITPEMIQTQYPEGAILVTPTGVKQASSSQVAKALYREPEKFDVYVSVGAHKKSIDHFSSGDRWSA